MSPLRGSGVVSSNISKGGLKSDIVHCGLCTDIVFYAVKKASRPNCQIFTTKAAKGAAKVRKGASKLLYTLAIPTFHLCALRRHGALCGKKTSKPKAVYSKVFIKK
jgi:hypothetical protein